MNYDSPLKLLFVTLSFLIMTNSATSQSIRQEKMAELSFLTGKWVGTSNSYADDGSKKSGPAYEEIQFKVDGTILAIDLHSESLQLHTIIFYDEKDETYYYHPYYKTGRAEYPAKLIDGKLIVSPNAEKRFVFGLTPEGNFREYGEVLKDGKWAMYFEDVFMRRE